MPSETDLYAPVKALLETKGYVVKAEIRGCDVVGRKPGAANVVIVELKLAFTLELVLQGIERQRLADDVYLAVLAPDTATKRKNWRSRQRSLKKLCRMLGLGLMLVRLDRPLERALDSQVEVLLDPAAYKPRKNSRQQSRLLTEFNNRAGDPNTAGVTRTKIMTAYRQDALRCAEALSGGRELKVGEIKSVTGVVKAGTILQKNHYGWFERVARGVYRLTPHGQTELAAYNDTVT